MCIYKTRHQPLDSNIDSRVKPLQTTLQFGLRQLLLICLLFATWTLAARHHFLQHDMQRMGELLQWLCHDDSTTNSVTGISKPHRSTTYVDAA